MIILIIRSKEGEYMGTSMWLARKINPKRNKDIVVQELIELLNSIGINSYEWIKDKYSDDEFYIWKGNPGHGIRVYVGEAEEVIEDNCSFYREIFFDAIYHDEDDNGDLLLDITYAYMEKYPDILLFGECSKYLYYDKLDIESVKKSGYSSDWYFVTKPHVSPIIY